LHHSLSKQAAGQLKYVSRAVDKAGNTIAVLLLARRDKAAARRCFEQPIAWNGESETVTIDKSSANRVELEAVDAERETPTQIRSRRSRA
jgi:transposase-like protein